MDGIKIDLDALNAEEDESIEMDYAPSGRRGNGREPIKITTANKSEYKVNNPTLKLYDVVLEEEKRGNMEDFYYALVDFKVQKPDKYEELIGNSIDLDGLDEE